MEINIDVITSMAEQLRTGSNKLLTSDIYLQLNDNEEFYDLEKNLIAESFDKPVNILFLSTCFYNIIKYNCSKWTSEKIFDCHQFLLLCLNNCVEILQKFPDFGQLITLCIHKFSDSLSILLMLGWDSVNDIKDILGNINKAIPCNNLLCLRVQTFILTTIIKNVKNSTNIRNECSNSLYEHVFELFSYFYDMLCQNQELTSNDDVLLEVLGLLGELVKYKPHVLYDSKAGLQIDEVTTDQYELVNAWKQIIFNHEVNVRVYEFAQHKEPRVAAAALVLIYSFFSIINSFYTDKKEALKEIYNEFVLYSINVVQNRPDLVGSPSFLFELARCLYKVRWLICEIFQYNNVIPLSQDNGFAELITNLSLTLMNDFSVDNFISITNLVKFWTRSCLPVEHVIGVFTAYVQLIARIPFIDKSDEIGLSNITIAKDKFILHYGIKLIPKFVMPRIMTHRFELIRIIFEDFQETFNTFTEALDSTSYDELICREQKLAIYTLLLQACLRSLPSNKRDDIVTTIYSYFKTLSSSFLALIPKLIDMDMTQLIKSMLFFFGDIRNTYKIMASQKSVLSEFMEATQKFITSVLQVLINAECNIIELMNINVKAFSFVVSVFFDLKLLKSCETIAQFVNGFLQNFHSIPSSIQIPCIISLMSSFTLIAYTNTEVCNVFVDFLRDRINNCSANSDHSNYFIALSQIIGVFKSVDLVVNEEKENRIVDKDRDSFSFFKDVLFWLYPDHLSRLFSFNYSIITSEYTLHTLYFKSLCTIFYSYDMFRSTIKKKKGISSFTKLHLFSFVAPVLVNGFSFIVQSFRQVSHIDRFNVIYNPLKYMLKLFIFNMDPDWVMFEAFELYGLTTVKDVLSSFLSISECISMDMLLEYVSLGRYFSKALSISTHHCDLIFSLGSNMLQRLSDNFVHSINKSFDSYSGGMFVVGMKNMFEFFVRQRSNSDVYSLFEKNIEAYQHIVLSMWQRVFSTSSMETDLISLWKEFVNLFANFFILCPDFISHIKELMSKLITPSLYGDFDTIFSSTTDAVPQLDNIDGIKQFNESLQKLRKLCSSNNIVLQ